MKEFTFPVRGQERPVHAIDRAEDLTEFKRWIVRQADVGRTVSVDTETKGLAVHSSTDYVRLAQFGTAAEAWTVPVELGATFKAAARWALGTLPRIAWHNGTFDALALSKNLGTPLDPMFKKARDTMILAKLRDPRATHEGGIGAGLKPLSAFFVDPSAPDTQGDLTAVFRSLKLTKATGWAGIDLFHPTYQSYAGGDVILTAELLPILEAELRELGVPPVLVEYEHELARICAHMAQAGMVLDEEYTRALQSRLAEEQEHYARVAAGFGVEKVGAPKQVAECLLAMKEDFILPGKDRPEYTDSGALKTDKAVLMFMADLDKDWKRVGRREPNLLADAVIRSKRAGKWKAAYADNFLSGVTPEGRIHANIQTLQARTGRMSVTNPAVQTLPSSDWMIRRSLLADEGHRIISTDFQAIELRVLAALADVREMKRAIREGEDLHSFTRDLVFPGVPDPDEKLRKLCKGIGFGKVYGGGALSISRLTGAPMADVERALRAYDRVYPEVRQAGRRWQEHAMANQMVGVSATGRRLPLDRDRTYAITNYYCQSLARDCLGQALIDMDAKGLTPYLRLPVHDEVIASAPEKETEEVGRAIAECMTFDLMGVPIEATPDVRGRSWGSAYMKGADLMIQEDPYYAAHPDEAHALAAA